MIRRRIALGGFVLAFASGTIVGSTLAHERPSSPRLAWCQSLIQQARADACDLITNLGGLGGP